MRTQDCVDVSLVLLVELVIDVNLDIGIILKKDAYVIKHIFLTKLIT